MNFLPNFIVNHAGDTLWAMMVYFLFRFIFAGKSHSTAFYLTFIFCFSIELSQLYQADWINTIRSTMLGSLIFGKGFLGVDLIRYSIGIVIAFLMDKWIPSLIAKNKNKFC